VRIFNKIGTWIFTGFFINNKGFFMFKRIVFSAVLNFLFLIGLKGGPLQASFNEEEFKKIKSYFEKDAEVINKSLQNFKTAELHFFWTTGYMVDSENEYGVNLDIKIGGKTYAPLFPDYLGLLLKNSPNKLNIKFVCDPMTRDSNEWITKLHKTYETRFQILDSEDVLNNLLKAFPKHAEIITVIFLNATQGNPAIPSDFYRLIGMLYGSGLDLIELEKILFTYCDVDTFCYGMSCPNEEMGFSFVDEEIKQISKKVDGHTNLIKALFAPLNPEKRKTQFLGNEPLDPKETFYIGKRHTGSSIIKLWVKELKQYEKICTNILRALDYNRKNINILNYFSLLQKNVRQEANIENNFISYIDKFSHITVKTNDIIDETGPGFLKKFFNAQDHWPIFPLNDHPDITAMEWHRTHYLENLDLVEEANLEKKFTQYTNRISDAFYTLKFGMNHPFNKKMRDYLTTEFPYATLTFKSYFKELYEKDTKEKEISIDDWLDKKFEILTKHINTSSDIKDEEMLKKPYYFRLNYVLKLLGVKRSLTLQDIDWREVKESANFWGSSSCISLKN
jgi:hypothetical protein